MTRGRAAVGLAMALVIAAVIVGGTASAVLFAAAMIPLLYAVIREARRLRDEGAGSGGGGDNLPGAGLPPF